MTNEEQEGDKPLEEIVDELATGQAEEESGGRSGAARVGEARAG